MKPITDGMMMQATQALGKYLRNYPEYYQEACDRIQYLIGVIRSSLDKGVRPPAIVREMHLLMDMEAEKATKARKPICKRGCAHCCYVQVDISTEEAILLLAYALEFKIEIDWNAVERQADVKEHTDMSHADRRCVFLSHKNECQVYDARPSACRKYFIGKGTPDQCDSKKFPNGDVAVLTAPGAEVIASALGTVSEMNRMPIKLIEAIDLVRKNPADS